MEYVEHIPRCEKQKEVEPKFDVFSKRRDSRCHKMMLHRIWNTGSHVSPSLQEEAKFVSLQPIDSLPETVTPQSDETEIDCVIHKVVHNYNQPASN